MRISHKHKFIFLSNPRCGSTSVRQMLAKYSDISSTSEYPYHHHTGARGLKNNFELNGWAWEEYTSITTIRNPWDRVVSIYHYGKRNPKSVWNKLYSKASSFEEFVTMLPKFLDKNVYSGGHKKAGQRGISIAEFAYSIDGEKLIDNILPIETIDDSLPSLVERLGLPNLQVPTVNATKHESHRDYFNAETRAIIANIFSKDIEIGDYSF